MNDEQHDIRPLTVEEIEDVSGGLVKELGQAVATAVNDGLAVLGSVIKHGGFGTGAPKSTWL